MCFIPAFAVTNHRYRIGLPQIQARIAEILNLRGHHQVRCPRRIRPVFSNSGKCHRNGGNLKLLRLETNLEGDVCQSILVVVHVDLVQNIGIKREPVGPIRRLQKGIDVRE